MKYWSCCSRKKFFEFEEFLSHPGCEAGSHRWFKDPSELAKEKQCRLVVTRDHAVAVAAAAECLTVECVAAM